MAALYSLSIGICATAFTVDVWNKVGQTFRKVVTDTGDSTIIEVYVDLEAMYDAYIPGGGNDPDDELKWAEKLKTALSRGLLGAIAGWLCTLVNMGGYEVVSEYASSGWSYYGEFLYPTFPEPFSTSYMCIVNRSDGHRLYISDGPFIVKKEKFLYLSSGTKICQVNLYDIDFSLWDSNTSYSIKTNNASTTTYYDSADIVWANHDIISTTTSPQYIWLEGSDPYLIKTDIIEPTIYVGDIPEQIQNGDKDEDNLILPIIDPFRVIQSPETALDDVNQLQQQLANGTITLDQYLEQVTYQEPTQPDDPSTDPTSPTSPSVDPDPWEPPEDPGQFTLDLTQVFPFCIPFDLYAFLTCLNADPVTPVIHWEIAMPGGGSYPLEIDLSPFDSLAQLLRRLELLLFCIGLAIKTRDLIKG